MKHIREAVVIGAAAALVATGCSANQAINGTPTPQPSTTRTPDIGRNEWPSELRYKGHATRYLLAINCDTDPNGKYSATLPSTPQPLSEALTVGATDEHVPADEHDMTATINFLAGLTVRRDTAVSLEFARSDEAPDSGYADTVRDGGTTEYLRVPGKAYMIVVGLDPDSGDINLSCSPTQLNPPAPELTPISAAPLV